MRQIVATVLLGLAGLAAAQTVPALLLPEPPPAADLREQIVRLPVTVKDAYGRTETRSIAVTQFRPAGDGPFEFVVMNHGRAPADRRAQQGRQRFEALSRYLVSKGYAVFVPTRVGYGDTYGAFDPETGGNCNAMRLAPVAQAAADQVLATADYAATLPWIDAGHWVVMGVSVGGFTTLAVAARQPPGLVAAVNFSGGHGGRPDTNPGDPCGARVLTRLAQEQAASATVPMLWLYWDNDRYWGADWPQRWAQAWRDGGGQVDLRQLPAVGADGHAGMGVDMDHWVPLVEAYLAQRGHPGSGLIARPPASGHAALADTDKVPVSAAVRSGLYQSFLQAKTPRAFAVGPNGASGFATGDWALGRALGFCQARRGAPCKLYAVDDDVVWQP